MSQELGGYLPVSLPRRLIIDLLHFAQKIPSVPVQREMNLHALREIRSTMAQPISWCTIFLKAYGRVAEEFPELRRAYLPFPRPRIYEHPFSIGSVAIERDYQGEKAVFFAHVRAPERKTLRELDYWLRQRREEPIEHCGQFRRALTVSRLPRPLRRLIWWVGLNSSGPKRAKRMGTFGVSVYSALGAESLHPLSPLSTTLNYGVFRPDGTIPVRIIYDHRLMDGATVARALVRLDGMLHEEVLAELYSEKASRAA